MQDHGGFTSKAKDWEILQKEVYVDKRDALQMEKIIKKQGAR
jgi:predicted GIY-YIG superfamily endonuclease